jgi:hypothetical protein
MWALQQGADPIRQIEAYYDDLDFRRFETAYQRLNPETRPDFDQFMLNMSVQGGLVASYSKLEELKTDILIQEQDYMEVAVNAKYITALSYYSDTVTLNLSRSDEHGWSIEPGLVDVTVPPEQFVRRPTVEWLSQGRGRPTTETTDFADILDRPELQILSSQLVAREGTRYSIVGELMNIDADPADITVTGYMYDTEGNELTWYNAGAGMAHKLMPQDITPFRVDFEGVAGILLADAAKNFSFEPNETWDYVLPTGAELGDYDVFAKAVITARDLDREVGIQGLTVAENAGSFNIEGQLINSGLAEAVIPHIFVTYYSEDGKVMWVDHHFLPESVRAQRALDFSVPVTPIEELEILEKPGHEYSNSLTNLAFGSGPRSDFIPMPPESGYDYARVSLNYFTGGTR